MGSPAPLCHGQPPPGACGALSLPGGGGGPRQGLALRVTIRAGVSAEDKGLKWGFRVGGAWELVAILGYGNSRPRSPDAGSHLPPPPTLQRPQGRLGPRTPSQAPATQAMGVGSHFQPVSQGSDARSRRGCPRGLTQRGPPPRLLCRIQESHRAPTQRCRRCGGPSDVSPSPAGPASLRLPAREAWLGSSRGPWYPE